MVTSGLTLSASELMVYRENDWVSVNAGGGIIGDGGSSTGNVDVASFVGNIAYGKNLELKKEKEV